MIVSFEKFGRDHFSTLAYVETCCVDNAVGKGVGKLDKDRVRCNPKRHPLLVGPRIGMAYASGCMKWQDCGTRLREGVLAQHDDYDCLDDLEAAGLVEVISLVNGFVRMTPKGTSLAHQIRTHKIKGGTWSTFVADEKTLQS